MPSLSLKVLVDEPARLPLGGEGAGGLDHLTLGRVDKDGDYVLLARLLGKVKALRDPRAIAQVGDSEDGRGHGELSSLSE